MSSNAASRARSGRYVSAIVPPGLLRCPHERPLEVPPPADRLRHHSASTDLVLTARRHTDLLHVVVTGRVVVLRPLGDRATSVDRQRTDEGLPPELPHPCRVGRVLHTLRHQTLRSGTRQPSCPKSGSPFTTNRPVGRIRRPSSGTVTTSWGWKSAPGEANSHAVVSGRSDRDAGSSVVRCVVTRQPGTVCVV